MFKCQYAQVKKRVRVMGFNATSNNISDISLWSIYWWRKFEGLEENHRPVASHLQTLSLNVIHLAMNSQYLWWYAPTAKVDVNPTTIRSRPRQTLHLVVLYRVRLFGADQKFNMITMANNVLILADISKISSKTTWQIWSWYCRNVHKMVLEKWVVKSDHGSFQHGTLRENEL